MIAINALLVLVILFLAFSVCIFIMNNPINDFGTKYKIVFFAAFIILYAYIFYYNQTKVKDEKPGYVFIFNLIHSLNLLSMGLQL